MTEPADDRDHDILWVEDDPDHQLLMQLATRATPFASRHDLVTTVAAGVRAFHAAVEEGRPYRVVATDLQLDGGSGWDVIEGMAGRAGTRFVVLSSSDRVEDVARSEELGASYRSKPLELAGWTALGDYLVELADGAAEG